MGTNNGSSAGALATTRVEAEIDARTTARVVESVILRGDISALTPEERSRHYLQLCDALGLNPSTQPLAPLKLNGKEILYPTRGATDQLAAIHRLNREIIDGPKVIDVGGAKLVYAVCRATHPNGRSETATGMVPLPSGADNICNAFLKTETKARRRATLGILGLGMLDESEIESIPASAKAPGASYALPANEPDEHPALARLRDALESAETFEAVVAVYDELAAAHDGEPHAELRRAAFEACIAHLDETLGLTKQRVRFGDATKALFDARTAAKRAAHEAKRRAAEAAGEPPAGAWLGEHQFLRTIRAATTGKALVALAAQVDGAPRETRGELVEAYVLAWEHVIAGAATAKALDAMADVIRVRLPRELAEEVTAGAADAIARRRAELEPPPTGTDAPPAHDAAADAAERAAIAAEAGAGSVAQTPVDYHRALATHEAELVADDGAWKGHLKAEPNAFAVARAWLKREHAFDAAGVGRERTRTMLDVLKPLLATDSDGEAIAFARNQAKAKRAA